MANPHYYEIVLNVPFDDAVGTTAKFADYSVRNAFVRPTGSAGDVIVSTTSKFAGHNSLSIPGASAVFADAMFSSGMYGQVEMHIRFTSLTGLQDVLSVIGVSGFQLFCSKTTGNQLQVGTASLAAVTGGPTLAVNTWYHLAMVCDNYGASPQVRVYLEGTQIISFNVTGVSPFNAVSGLYIGNGPNGATPSMLVCNLLVTTVPRYFGTTITPPTAPFDRGTLPITANFAAGRTFLYALSYLIMPPVKTIYHKVDYRSQYQLVGNGFISGTTKIKDTPNNDPVSRKVRLYNEHDGSLIAEQWSDATTGAYSFNNISQAITYTVIAYDHLHNFRAVVADNLIPDTMP